MEALRDQILFGIGTRNVIMEVGPDQTTMQWRKPLRIDEINQIALTPEVLTRPGRP